MKYNKIEIMIKRKSVLQAGFFKCSLKFFFSFYCKINFICPFRLRIRMIYSGCYMVNKILLAPQNVRTKLSKGCENSYQEL